jgi:hypothetical protein
MFGKVFFPLNAVFFLEGSLWNFLGDLTCFSGAPRCAAPTARTPACASLPLRGFFLSTAALPKTFPLGHCAPLLHDL